MSRSRFKCPDADYVIQWKGVGFPPNIWMEYCCYLGLRPISKHFVQTGLSDCRLTDDGAGENYRITTDNKL